MLATSANGAGAADDAAAVRDDQGAVGEPGFVAGERAAPERVPDPELVEWAERRSFTAKCKLEILAKLEAGTRLGEVGELLRREGLYTSHLTYWRKQVRDGALKELGEPRGGKPADRGAPQCAKLVGERVPARTTAFVFDRPDHPRPHRRPSSRPRVPPFRPGAAVLRQHRDAWSSIISTLLKRSIDIERSGRSVD